MHRAKIFGPAVLPATLIALLAVPPAAVHGRGIGVGRILVTLPYSVVAFAQDGNRLAWLRGGCSRVRCERRNSAHVVDLSRNNQSVVPVGNEPAALAFAGRQLLVAELDTPCGLSDCSFTVRTATVGERTLRRVSAGWCDPSQSTTPTSCGRLLVAGDGSILAWVSYCREDCSSQAVLRVAGRDAVTLASPSNEVTALAVGGGRVAYAETSRNVSLVDSAGKRVSGFRVDGAVRALAVSRSIVVALVERQSTRSLEVRASATGTVQRTVALPKATAPVISLSGTTVVLRVGRSLRSVNTRTGRLLSLGTTAVTPIGLSVEGRRIAWAEATRNGARIRTLMLK